jgi:hypothetical protein
MGKGFSPFSDDSGEPRRRRKPDEIALARKSWEKKLDDRVRECLEMAGNPGIVSAEQLLNSCIYMHEMEESVPMRSVIRMNLSKIMERIGYAKLNNPNTKDGRWQVGKIFTTVYGKAILRSNDENLKKLIKDALS